MSHICPTCGRLVERQRPTNEYTGRRVQTGSAPDLDFNLFEYLSPARAAAPSSDVIVPLLQSAVSGFVVGLLTLWPTLANGWAWYVPLLVFGGVFAVAWFLLLADHRRSLWNRETIESGGTPSPIGQPDPVLVRLQVIEDGAIKYANLPIPIETLKTMARAIVNGRSFSVSEWTGAGRPLSRSQFETLRTWLLNNDYAEWVDPDNRRSGVTFSPAGWAFWRGLLEK
ncbi:MAG: hypothetical protein GY803_27540 [Chloroflexi bacterium]|nr:hypothetical protein [Chloroflexota bacterium]